MKFRRVVGNSMIPELIEGDILIITRKNQIAAGDIVVVNKNKREVVKRVKKVLKNNTLYIEGDNKHASTDSRDYGTVHMQTVIGVVKFKIGLLNPNRHQKLSDN